MTRTNSDILFYFLDIPPEKLAQIQMKPPMVSALQNFETSLSLIARGHHPQALSIIVSGIECAGKALLGIGPTESVNLTQLNPAITRELPIDKRWGFSALVELREKRNNFIHFGFSPRDNEESARLYFKTALPFLDAIIEKSVGISIIDSLVYDLGPMVKLAVKLISSDAKENISSLDAIRGVNRWINHHTRFSYLTWWEKEVLEDNESTFGSGRICGFDLKMELKEKLLNYTPSAIIDCPICGASDSLIINFDDKKFNCKELDPVSARCVECDLRLNEGKSLLLQQLCAKQLTPEFCIDTLKSYGLN